MTKPAGYHVYDVDSVMEWMILDNHFSPTQVSEFMNYFWDYVPETGGVVFFSTEDCKDVPGLKEILDEFGRSVYLGKGGHEIYEIYLNP